MSELPLHGPGWGQRRLAPPLPDQHWPFAREERRSSLLLVLPLVAYRRGEARYIDDQAANGLSQWLRHFERVTLCLKVVPGEPPEDFVEIDEPVFDGRLALEELPPGWTPGAHVKAYPAVRRRLSALIDAHDFLQFALMGGWGDWATLGIRLATARGRKCSVWTDRVESEVLRAEAARSGGLRRLSRQLNSRVARRNEALAVRLATLGLFHGKDTFDRFSPHSARPFLVHDIHLKPEDRIDEAELVAKLAACGAGPLKIVYAGRAHPDKGVMDWVAVLHRVHSAGVPIEARWYGQGPQLDEARARVERLGLADVVRFPGPLFDREELLARLREAHVMLFCHLTPESPRCLIEALAAGTPIVGYRSSYSEDLITEHGGGVLTAMQPAPLAAQVIALARDRTALAALIGNAARDGHAMNDEAVFEHRANLMKHYT